MKSSDLIYVVQQNYSPYKNSHNSGVSEVNFQYLCGNIGLLQMRGKDLKGVRVHEINT